MRRFRIYRGLHGETIRVPEDTITPPPRIHNLEPFPFAALARLAGEGRDRFAKNCLDRPWIGDGRKSPVSFSA